MSNRVNVVIGGQTDPSLGQSFDALLGRLTGMNGFLEGMRTQIATLVGAAGLAKLVHVGIEFNSQLQIAQRGLAGVFLQADQSVSSIGGAFTKAADAVAELQRQARSASADFSDLLTSYSANASLLFSAGVRDLRQQIELVTLLGDVVKSKGLPGNQAITEMRALFTGNFGPDALVANQLIPTSQRAAWREALGSGGAYDMLRPRLQPFADVAARASQDFDVAAGNLREAAASMLAAVTRPAFQSLGPAMANLAAALTSGKWMERVDQLIYWLKIGATAGVIGAAGSALSGAKNFALANLFGVGSFTELLSSARGGTLFVGASQLVRNIPLLAAKFSLLASAAVAVTAALEALRVRGVSDKANEAQAGARYTGQATMTSVMAQIDQAVSDGRIDAAQAARMRKRLRIASESLSYAEREDSFMGRAALAANPDLSQTSRNYLPDEIVAVTRELGGRVARSVSDVARGASNWSGKLPWDTAAGGGDGGSSVRGWLTRGSMQLWTQQINYARSMARDLGVIAQVVQRYLPKLQEQI